VLGVNHLVEPSSSSSPRTRPARQGSRSPSTVDASGFNEVLRRARNLACAVRGPVDHTASSRGFYLSDPDGRRLEFVHDDPGVYWRPAPLQDA